MKTEKMNLRVMKRVLAALLAVLLVLSLVGCGGKDKAKDESQPESSAATEATPTPAPTTVKVKIATVDEISGKLNIRSEPNTDSEILETALAGDEFEVLTENCQVGWHEISYKGGKAYVSADFVTVKEEMKAAPTPTPDPNAMIIVNGSGREESAEESSETGMTAENVEDTEDPARR